jgi:hypothetical protein
LNISAVLYACARANLPQVTDTHFKFEEGVLVGMDALGAMAYALDKEAPFLVFDDPLKIVAFIHDRTGRKGLLKVRRIPNQRRGKIRVYRIITRLNDERGWSFLQIADWMHKVNV